MEPKKLNVLVTGGNGQLGCALRALSKGSAHHFVFTDITDLPGYETVFLDVTNPAAVALICDSENIDVIVNCVAFTNVEKAEDNSTEVSTLNVEVPGELAKIARKRKATLIHISTDYIFSGNTSTPITEDSQPAPLSVYGSTKLAGEKAIIGVGCKYIILRTAWLYSSYGRNFVKTMLRLFSEKDSLSLVYDQVGTPTFADDLAAFIVSILDKGQLCNTGIYNYTNLGVTSWYDFAVEIQRLAASGAPAAAQTAAGPGVPAPAAPCRLSPCLSAEYPQKARRPSYSVLDKALVQKTFGVQIPHWSKSLAKCMKQLGYGN